MNVGWSWVAGSGVKCTFTVKDGDRHLGSELGFGVLWGLGADRRMCAPSEWLLSSGGGRRGCSSVQITEVAIVLYYAKCFDFQMLASVSNFKGKKRMGYSQCVRAWTQLPASGVIQAPLLAIQSPSGSSLPHPKLYTL